MPDTLAVQRALAIRKAGYLLFLLTPTLMPAGWMLGRDTANPDKATETATLRNQRDYRAQTLLVMPIQLLLAWGGWVFVHADLGF